MSEHHASIHWKRNTDDFVYETYDRNHSWKFSGGIEIKASAAPGYKGDPSCLDPEEAFVASLSSCHMLTFLALAAKKRLVVDEYKDDAVGVLDKKQDGKLSISKVILHPEVRFSPDTPVTAKDLEHMHHRSHEECFIANSVKTEVLVEAK
jgi:organic hydroperoxide reductase OsmC/OhrA